MRIALLTTSYPSSPGDAAGHFVAAEAEALIRAGHRVCVFCPDSEELSADGAHPPDAPRVFRAPAFGATGVPGVMARLKDRPWRVLGLLAWSQSARRWLAREGPFDRVIAHWLFPCAYPVLVWSDTGRAELEVVVHGSDARVLQALPRRVQQEILRRFVQRAVMVRCVSSELAAILRAAAPITHCPKIVVRKPELDVETGLTRDTARSELGIAPSQRLVVIAARLIASKRVATALAAAELAGAECVVVLGAGPERAALAARFPNARFFGQVSRPTALRWLCAADVVLSASLLEGAPSVVREARALGTRVVASAAGDLIEDARQDPDIWLLVP